MKKTSDELEHGLTVDNCSVKDRVLKMFKECGVIGIYSSADKIVNAHIVNSENARPAIRFVVNDVHFIYVKRDTNCRSFCSPLRNGALKPLDIKPGKSLWILILIRVRYWQ